MKFLIIDDDIDSCRLLAKRLERFGGSIYERNPSAACDIFFESHQAKTPFDVIFLDIVMPETDGHDMLKKIRAFEESNLEPEDRTPVVMVSAKKDPTNIFASVKEGCDHYMTKPIRKAGLDEVMRKLGIAPLEEVV